MEVIHVTEANMIMLCVVKKLHTEICERVSLFIPRGFSVLSDVCPVHERWKKLPMLFSVNVTSLSNICICC